VNRNVRLFNLPTALASGFNYLFRQFLEGIFNVVFKVVFILIPTYFPGNKCSLAFKRFLKTCEIQRVENNGSIRNRRSDLTLVTVFARLPPSPAIVVQIWIHYWHPGWVYLIVATIPSAIIASLTIYGLQSSYCRGLDLTT